MSRRSPLAVLAVLSLVGSLLALSTAPVAARNGEADDVALYTACLGSALEPAGFRDVTSGGVAEGAINCMANYGIMPDILPGLFRPRLGVTRQQMALFLVRAAPPAGIDLPEAEDHGFRDIGELSTEVQDAINQLVELRITLGRTASSFDPHSVVNRGQMAQFLTRFLEAAPVAEGGVSIESVVPDDTIFDDIRNIPHDPYDAIRLLYELGITKGTTSRTYGPDEPVTRAQMALFISRILAHTNARPAGATVQAEETSVTAGDTVELIIAVRDEDNLPVADAFVDMFYVARSDDGFLSNGRCTSKAVFEWGDTRCAIDIGDETTDGDGNIYYTMIVDETREVFVWTGDRGDRFDIDDTEHFSLALNASKGAETFLLTDDMLEGADVVPFGVTVTFTFQLVDEDENPVAEEDVEIRIETVEENDGQRDRERVRTYDTDSDGKVELSFRLTDPDSRDNDRDGELNMDVLRHDYDDEPIIDKTKVKILTGSRRLLWSDNDEVPTTLLLEQDTVYTTASDEGTGARNRVSATLLDQYGEPVRGKRVHFTSNDAEGLYSKLDEQGDPLDGEAQKPAYRKTTSSRGVATLTYRRDSDTMDIETIYADTEDVEANSIEHYWVRDIPEGETTIGDVVLYDEDEDLLVIDEDGNDDIYVVEFDSEDQFDYAVGAVSYKAFKEALEEELADGGMATVEAVINTNDPDDVNRFILS